MTVEPLSRQEVRTLQEQGRRLVQKKYSTLQELKVEYVAIDSIYPNSYNPNRQTERDFALLIKSIVEDGFTQPIVVQRISKEIVDGEHRWKACHQLGLEEIPVVFVDMTPEQMRISTLRHNRARGSEDIELSIQMLQDLRALGSLDQAVSSLMIDERDLAALLDDLPAPLALADEVYSKGWEPQAGGSLEDVSKGERQTANKHVSTSERAIDISVQKTQEIQNAESHTDAMNKNRELKAALYNLTASYKGEDGRAIRETLGSRPAEVLLALCLRKIARFPEIFDPVVVEAAGRLKGDA